MDWTAIIGIIGGIFKFWDDVVWFVQALQKTPQEKIAETRDAFRKAVETKGDTSDVEGSITSA